MTDRKKAINGLECCLPMTMRNGLGDCENCPYDREITLEGGITECCHELMLDVLAMLKAQEPKLVHVTADINRRKIGECPNCGKLINSGDYPNYCGRCGQAVKWEDAMNLRMIVSGHRQTIIAAVANGGTANDRL